MNTYEKSDTLLKWELFEYCSPNGRLAIVDWRKSLPVGPPRADLDTFLRDMAKKEEWKPPDIDALRGGAYKGFTELRWKSCKVQHRIFGREIGDHKYLMIIGCTHKESYDPPGVWDSLLERWGKIQAGEATYVGYKLIANR